MNSLGVHVVFVRFISCILTGMTWDFICTTFMLTDGELEKRSNHNQNSSVRLMCETHIRIDFRIDERLSTKGKGNSYLCTGSTWNSIVLTVKSNNRSRLYIVGIEHCHGVMNRAMPVYV